MNDVERRTLSFPFLSFPFLSFPFLSFSFLFFSFLFLFLFFSFLHTAWNAAWQLPNAVRVQAVNGTLCSLCWPPCALLIRGLEQNNRKLECMR